MKKPNKKKSIRVESDGSFYLDEEKVAQDVKAYDSFLKWLHTADDKRKSAQMRKNG